MKLFSIIHILLFLLCLLVCKCASAQSDYVVTLRGDTLHGEVKPLMYGVEKRVQLTDTDKKKNTYSILQTRAFRYNDEIYKPVRNNQGYTFMKLLKPGYLSLYAFQMENQTTYDGLFLLKRDGDFLEVPNISFKKQMTRFLEDCATVSAKIEAGELGKKELNQIVEEYNQCIENNTVDHAAIIVQNEIRDEKISTWDNLEQKIKAQGDFDGKNTALEMITEIKNKLKRSEQIPTFMKEGLKSTLTGQEALKEDLDKALKELEKEN